jgi:hypothetical protein
MSMPVVADSLGPKEKKQTLEAQARPHEKMWRGEMCRDCRTNPHPRGWDPSQQLCWYCVFPRYPLVNVPHVSGDN